MPSVLIRLLLLSVFCLCASFSWALIPAQGGAMVLADSTESSLVRSNVATWIEDGTLATIDQVARSADQFDATVSLAPNKLAKSKTLWIRLRLVGVSGSDAKWTLNIPTPSLDSVTLYQPDGLGGWSAQRAGDMLAQTEWYRPGLYPDFHLNLIGDMPVDIYLAVRNYKPESIPIRLATQAARENQRQRELLAIAMALGALLSLAALSVLRFAEHRKLIDGFAALFGLLIMVTVAQFEGVMNAFVWFRYPNLADLSASILPVITTGCILLFVQSIFARSMQGRVLNRLAVAVGAATVAWALIFGVLDRQLADRTGAGAMLLATMLSVAVTIFGWRSGSLVARWLLVALVPHLIVQIYALLSGLELVPLLWEMRYLASIATALTVPVLLYALSQHTHDRKELVVRANHLPTQDALTGLLTKEVFQTHLEESVERAIDTREPIALVMVRVINHEQIRQTFGDTTAEQCLLRAVVKLQRILRDVDPAGRVGSAHFALLMEGVTTREAVNERMVKLIASGLIPLPGLVPEVTLYFQAACVLLHNNPVPADRVLDDLRELLAGMAPHTRRPIRFLEALPTEASPLHSQSEAG